MIQSFQKFSQSRIAKVFLGIVALSFLAFFGNGSWFRSHDPNAIVAEVGNLSIRRYELAEKVQRYAQGIAAQSGETPTHEQLLSIGLPQMILKNLIDELLLNLEAQHLGLTVSDEAIRNHIHSMSAFQNEEGEFNRAHFTQVLRANGLSEDVFISEIRQELMREQLANAIMVGAYLPDEMVDPLFDIQYQHRQAAILKISSKEIPLPPTPSNDVLEAFYKKYEQNFKTPELRTITFLILDPALISKDIAVTDDELKSTYEAKSETFGKKSFEEAKPFVLAEIQKEKATEQIYKITQELDDKIAGGATFEELAPTIKGAQLIKLTDVDVKGQDRMEVPSPQLTVDKDLAQEILKTAFELEEGADSPFTQARNGASFTARVDKIVPGGLQPLEAIKDRVLKIWSENEQLKAAYAKAEKYVKAFNQRSQSTSLLTLLPDLSLAEASPSVPDEIKYLAYSLHVGQAGMTRIPEGFAVVVLNKIIPPTAKIKEDKMASFKRNQLKRYQSDLLTSYINALRIRYPVKINKAAIQSLHTP